MRAPRLFVDQPLSQHATLTLRDAPAHHVRNVLRLRPDAAVILFNGRGGQYEGVITSVNRSGVEVSVTGFLPDDRESHLYTCVGLAVTKRDAMDFAIQKATELGVSEIAPLTTDHVSVSRSTITGRSDHWRQVIISACEQCERNRLPKLLPPSSLTAWLAQAKADLKLVAHPGDGFVISDLTAAPRSVDLLVGPEGGLSDTEVVAARDLGFVPIRLGDRILRAETAPVAALTLLQSRWGDLSGSPQQG